MPLSNRGYFSTLLNSNFLFSIFLLIFFLLVTVYKLPHIPQRTHELAALMATLDCNDCGLGHLVNSLIVSPIYYFIGFAFMTLKNYLIIQCVFFFISIIIFNIIFLNVIKSENKSIIYNISLILTTFILLLNFIGGNWSNIPEYLGIGVNFLNYNFSARSILSLSYFISCYFLIKKRIIFSGLFIAIGMLSHPTNGLIICLSIGGLLIFNYFQNLGIKNADLKKLLLFLTIGFIPVIIKLLSIDNILYDFQGQEVSSYEYVTSMYRDEIDDFSALYRIFSSRIILVASLLFSLVPISISYLLRKKLKEIIKIKILSILILTPIIIFLIILSVETIFNSFGLLDFVLEKIINSQLGTRILQYSGIPATIIWFILINEFFNYLRIHFLLKFKMVKNYLKFFSLFLFTIITFLIINSENTIQIKQFINIFSGDSKKFSENGRMAYYEDLLKAGYEKKLVEERFLYDCKCGNIYMNVDNQLIKKYKQTFFKSYKPTFEKNLSFDQNYENYFSRKKIASIIKTKLEKGSKIITPPYFYCFREFLPNYDIYFQEHDDGNFMLGSKKIYEKFKPRMNSISFSYQNIPSQASNLLAHEIRTNWLKLKGESFNSNKFEEFEYLLTESSHIINLEILYQDKNWIIYKIN